MNNSLRHHIPPADRDRLQLLPPDDIAGKLSRIRSLMAAQDVRTMVIGDNANKFYLTGRVFAGYIIIREDRVLYMLRRPNHLEGDGVHAIRKPEDIPAVLAGAGITATGMTALELGATSYNAIQRLAKALDITPGADADAILRQARAVKTPHEIELMERDSQLLDTVYGRIPSLYSEGMSDQELQIAIESVTRRLGGLGILRVNGDEMELNGGSVLAGDNADEPSPYDFAMGGRGPHPSLPAGADGTLIKPGMTVMVDTNGNFNGYMTDMTRTFACGPVNAAAAAAHALSVNICRALECMGTPGTPAKELYDRALKMAADAGMDMYFMGHRAKAGFVGHGVGIAINEVPVIAPRSRDILQEGNVIALEPKFVIPGTGAAGIENTYVVTPGGLRQLTHAPENLINLLP